MSAVNHPPHYTSGPLHSACGQTIECIDIAEGQDFLLGNVIKYVWRAGKKGPALEDLKKAQWYLSRAIENQDGRQ